MTAVFTVVGASFRARPSALLGAMAWDDSMTRWRALKDPPTNETGVFA